MNTEKLLALADHLESGKLNLVWDFSTFMGLPKGSSTGACGTCGCAIGEWSTIVGGRLADMVREYVYVECRMGAHVTDSIQELCCAEFDISPAAFEFLFIPCTDESGWLTGDAGPREVARLIRWFVNHDGEVLERSQYELEQFEDSSYDRNTINIPD